MGTRILISGVLMLLIVMSVFGSVALAGGGPGPGGAGPEGCWAYYVADSDQQVLEWGSVTKMDPDQELRFHIWANCPLVVSNTWNGEAATVTQYDIDNGEYGMSNVPVVFTTDPGMLPGVHFINAVFVADPTTVYQYVRVLIGDLEPLPLSLSLQRTGARWASYEDYTNRFLTMDFKMKNVGQNDAYHVRMTGATATNGVLPMDCPGDYTGNCFPRYVEYLLEPGIVSEVASVKFVIPPSVTSFRVSIYASAEDYYGQIHTFP